MVVFIGALISELVICVVSSVHLSALQRSCQKENESIALAEERS